MLCLCPHENARARTAIYADQVILYQSIKNYCLVACEAMCGIQLSIYCDLGPGSASLAASNVAYIYCRYGPCEVSYLQERMKRAVALLGEEEVQNIMRDEGKIEVCTMLTLSLFLSL